MLAWFSSSVSQWSRGIRAVCSLTLPRGPSAKPGDPIAFHVAAWLRRRRCRCVAERMPTRPMLTPVWMLPPAADVPEPSGRGPTAWTRGRSRRGGRTTTAANHRRPQPSALRLVELVTAETDDGPVGPALRRVLVISWSTSTAASTPPPSAGCWRWSPDAQPRANDPHLRGPRSAHHARLLPRADRPCWQALST